MDSKRYEKTAVDVTLPRNMPTGPAPSVVAETEPATVYDQLVRLLANRVCVTATVTDALVQRLSRMSFPEEPLPNEEPDIIPSEGLLPLKTLTEELDRANRRLGHLLDRLQV